MIAKSVLPHAPSPLTAAANSTLLQYFGRPFSLNANHVDGLGIKISARNRGRTSVHVLVYPVSVTQGEQ